MVKSERNQDPREGAWGEVKGGCEFGVRSVTMEERRKQDCYLTTPVTCQAGVGSVKEVLNL